MTDGVDGLATTGHAMEGDDLATIVKDKADGDKAFEVRASMTMTTGIWARDQDLEGAVEAQRSKVRLDQSSRLGCSNNLAALNAALV